MSDLVFAWNDRTARMECVGVSTWNGKDGLLPAYARKPDLELASRGVGKQELISDTDLRTPQPGRPPGPAPKCACGRVRTQRAALCRVCYRRRYCERGAA